MAARATDRTTFQREAERRFPYRVDIPVSTSGFGRQLTELHDWCRTHVAPGQWAQHGFVDKTRHDDRGVALEFTRWYFMAAADAEAFKQRWHEDQAPASIPRIRLEKLTGGVRALRNELLAYFQDGCPALDPKEAADAAHLMEEVHDLLLKVAIHTEWVDRLAQEPPALGSFSATRSTVVTELDILRSAKLVLDQHGEDALVHAARRADELLERGDVQGYEVWLAIFAVLESARAHLSGMD